MSSHTNKHQFTPPQEAAARHKQSYLQERSERVLDDRLNQVEREINIVKNVVHRAKLIMWSASKPTGSRPEVRERLDAMRNDLKIVGEQILELARGPISLGPLPPKPEGDGGDDDWDDDWIEVAIDGQKSSGKDSSKNEMVVVGKKDSTKPPKQGKDRTHRGWNDGASDAFEVGLKEEEVIADDQEPVLTLGKKKGEFLGWVRTHDCLNHGAISETQCFEDSKVRFKSEEDYHEDKMGIKTEGHDYTEIKDENPACEHLDQRVKSEVEPKRKGDDLSLSLSPSPSKKARRQEL